MLSRLCWTCRHRRVVCDGADSGCSQCTVIGVNCTGYGAASSAAEEQRGRALTRLSPDAVPVTATTGDGVATRKMSIVCDPATPLYSEAQMVFDGIHYCMSLVPSSSSSVTVPGGTLLTHVDSV